MIPGRNFLSRIMLSTVACRHPLRLYLVSLNCFSVVSKSPRCYSEQRGRNNTKASPFVLAAQVARIKAVLSIINVEITIAVIRVANSSSYASTRASQALAINDCALRSSHISIPRADPCGVLRSKSALACWLSSTRWPLVKISSFGPWH